MKPDDFTLQMFADVDAHWWGNGMNDTEIDRSAKAVLEMSGFAQGVHRHSVDVQCARGGGCYVLRLPETTA